jgi:hypothetical protein
MAARLLSMAFTSSVLVLQVLLTERSAEMEYSKMAGPLLSCIKTLVAKLQQMSLNRKELVSLARLTLQVRSLELCSECYALCT